MSTLVPVSEPARRAICSTSASFSDSLAVSKSRDQYPDARAVHRRIHLVRMHEAFVALGRLRRQPIRRQAIDEARRGLDRVHHALLRIPRMRIEADERHHHRIRREALELQLPDGAAVERVGADGAEARDVEMIGAASDLLVRRETDAGCGRAGSPDARSGARPQP